MPRVVGIFADRAAVDAVIEQLTFNGIDRTTWITATGRRGKRAERTQAVDTLRLPAAQASEYRTRLERSQYLLLVEASALELPTVQRLLRNGQVVDIDMLPETTS